MGAYDALAEAAASAGESDQTTIFDVLFDVMGDDATAKKATSKSVESIIEMLEAEKSRLEKAEKKEQEKRRRLEEEKRRKREQRAQEVQRITSMELPLDWENLFHADQRVEGVHAESAGDALLFSLNGLGRVDIEYMAEITGLDPKSIVIELKGAILQNPETWGECWYKGWETREQYLSGNLMRKRKAAIKANREFKEYFRENITAIDAALPQPLPLEEIYITLGSPWVPTDVIDEFANHIIGLDGSSAMNGTTHDPITGTWELTYRGRNAAGEHGTMVAHNLYGTDRVPALKILEDTLNMRTIRVTDSTGSSSSGKRVLNESETIKALEQQKKMVAEFKEWVWSDSARSEHLQIIYENNFSCVKQRRFDGSFLTFPEMNPQITLRPFQKNAVARMILMPNTLLAHDVGAGKTYMMIAAGMEMKRMGISNKNLYVVPNSILSQWKRMFTEIYPNAKVLTIEPKDFTPKKRAAALQKIRDEEFDAVLMTYSSFTMIELSNDEKIAALEQELDQIVEIISSSTSLKTKSIVKLQEKLMGKIFELKHALDEKQNAVSFDELGITRLFVDEAHNFKNVPIDTKMQDHLGISSKGSAKCNDMMQKVRCIQRQNDGAGVIFATGTPITNSVTDAFIMQKYLQNGELALIDLQSFDDWVRMFAEDVTEFEIDVDTSNFRMVKRLSRFHNIPELTTLLSSIADFHTSEDLGSLPEEIMRRDITIKRSSDFENFLEKISSRTDMIRSGLVPRNMDNMLLVTTDGRKAALDMRLINPQLSCADTKAMACAEKVADIYFATANALSTQLIFCDISTPKNGFNLYDELRSLLISLGVNPSHIAFAHDYETPSERNLLFRNMQTGTIRILLGSTFKIGLGVNVQDKLVAVHHLDVPWRPSDMEQREGRMLRPGNENNQVEIYRYITEGSFDAYTWQLLETKQRFITALLSGSIEQRSAKEIDDAVLDYAEVKAIAIGDERIKERVETANELSRLQMLQKEQRSMHESYRAELLLIPERRKELQAHIDACSIDEKKYDAWVERHPEEFQQKLTYAQKKARKQYHDALRDAVDDQIFSPRERQMPPYRGFGVTIPANVSPKEPFLFLNGATRYRVQLGESSRGYLMRIDFFIEHLEKHREEMTKNLQKLEAKEAELRLRLENADDYEPLIKAAKQRIAEIDRALGIEES